MKKRESFAERLQQVLDDKGMNQRRLSLQAKIGSSQISKYMKGMRATYENAQKLAAVLEVSVEWLLTGREEELAPGQLGREYFAVPLHQEIAAGEPIQNPLDFEDKIILHEAVVKRAGVNRKNLCAFRVKGESMEPQLSTGDIVICGKDPDVLRRRIPADDLYCIVDEESDGVTVKKVIYEKESRVLFLVPLNPVFSTQRLKLRKGANSPIIGKVIGAWRNM